MIKKINIDQALAGMFIHELCGSWLDNPFWSTSFPLKDRADLQKLQASGAREMWIDTDKGIDVAVAADDVAPAPTAAPAPPSPPAPPPVTAAPAAYVFPAAVATSTSSELVRASKIVQKSKSAIDAMFNDVRMGRMADTNAAMPIVEEIASSVLRNPGALISIARLKQADDYTYMHSVAVCAMMVALARQLDLPDAEVRDCGMAGLLHDIGKMAIAPDILNKPGRLTDSEFASVKKHPSAGHDILREASGATAMALDVCLHHHERVDGGGYPDGLKGDEISLHARMAAICDVYDAITSNRPYKEGWSPAISLRKMAEWAKDGHFDPTLFVAFIKCIGIYPLGTLVRLKSDRLAVVIDNSKSLLQPVVRVFFSVKSMVYLMPAVVDLALTNAQEGIASCEEASK